MKGIWRWAGILFLTCIGAEAQNNGVIDQIPAAEYNALLDLYNQLGGSGWTDKTGWLNPHATSWAGVEITGVSYDQSGNVAEEGNVTFLRLNGNGLTGSLPSSIGNFSQIEGLGLQDNQLTGAIPAQLGNLSQLQELYLHNNQFTGSIPAGLGNLSRLEELYLYGNQLTGAIPSELGNLAQLMEIYLQGNQLTGSVPSSLGNLSQLQTLALQENQLSGAIPTSLGSLSQLQELYLADNQLTGAIPTGIGNLTHLQYAYLDGNQLTGSLPSELGNLAQLIELDCSGNRLSGTIPASLAALTQLNYLALSDNQLSGTVPMFSGLQNVDLWDGLYVDGNRLEICLGTSSRDNINAMVAAGKRVAFDPQAPEVLSQPQDLALPHGSTAAFTVAAGCSDEDLVFQWRHAGTNVVDDTRISGSQTDTLEITGLLATDAGSYQVIVSGAAGSTASDSANLTVLKLTPVITWADPAPITNGVTLGPVQLNATANIPGTFAYDPAAGTLLPVGTNVLSVTFTPNNTTDYLSVNASVKLAVLPNLFYDGVNLANSTEAQADSDGDGLPNLVEYALGTDPRVGSDAKSGMTTSEMNVSGSRYASMQFKQRKSTPGLVVQYIPEVSNDRQTWASDGAHVVTVGITSLDSDYNQVTVRDATPTTSANPRFIRLRVTLSTE